MEGAVELGSQYFSRHMRQLRSAKWTQKEMQIILQSENSSVVQVADLDYGS